MPEIPKEILDNALERVIKETDIAETASKIKDQAYSIGYEAGQQIVRGVAAAYPKGPNGELAPDCPYCGVPLQFGFRSRTSRAVRASFPIYKGLRLSTPVNGNQPTPYPFWQCKKCKWFTPYQPPRVVKPKSSSPNYLLFVTIVGVFLVSVCVWYVIGTMGPPKPVTASPSPTPTVTPAAIEKTAPHKAVRGRRR